MFKPLLDDALDATAQGVKVSNDTLSDSDGITPPDQRDKPDDTEHNDTINVYGDAAYASRETFDTCKERDVNARIRLKSNSTARGRGHGDGWGVKVRDQLGGSPTTPVHNLSDDEKKANQKKWKKRVGYGKRWIVEIVFSAFKRLFGECVRAKKWDNMVQEVRIKVAPYRCKRGVERVVQAVL